MLVKRALVTQLPYTGWLLKHLRLHLGSTSYRHGSDVKVSDWCLINIDIAIIKKHLKMSSAKFKLFWPGPECVIAKEMEVYHICNEFDSCWCYATSISYNDSSWINTPKMLVKFQSNHRTLNPYLCDLLVRYFTTWSIEALNLSILIVSYCSLTQWHSAKILKVTFSDASSWKKPRVLYNDSNFIDICSQMFLLVRIGLANVLVLNT